MADATTVEREQGMPDRWHAAPHHCTQVRVLVAGDETDGRIAVVEARIRRDLSPPRHIHTREDELVCVLSGHLTFDLDGTPVDAPTGACVFLPRGGEHTFRVESDEARLLIIMTPAGLEGYYRELGPAGSPEVERLVATAARYGVTITGPGE